MSGVQPDRLSITATMTSSVLGMIKEEVTCPICLDLMVEPVSADCGHSFCRACITLNYESSKAKKGEGICPVCRVSYVFGNLRPNWHMANIVERLKEFKTSSEEEQKVDVCAEHGEKLQLFCEKDMVAICWLCERSQEHRGHQTALIDEVANKYKVGSRRMWDTEQQTVTDGKSPLGVTGQLPGHHRLWGCCIIPSFPTFRVLKGPDGLFLLII